MARLGRTYPARPLIDRFSVYYPKLETLTDNFAGSIDTTKWASFATGTATVSQSGGVVTVTPPSVTVGSDYAGYDSVNLYTLIGSYGFIQISTMVSTSTNAQCYYKVFVDGNNYLQWIQQNGTIKAQKVVNGGAPTDLYSAAYSSSTHQWVRIIESGGTVSFDSSTNGSSWTTQGTTANPFGLTSVKVEFAAGTFQSEITPGTAVFDNFNSVTVNAAIAQVAANLILGGGTQTITTVNDVNITQVAANITLAGSPQAVASVQNAAIAQLAGTITLTGGTQAIATVNNVSITQLAATITFSGGAQVVATVRDVAISQVAGTITFSGGTQTVATVNDVSISQSAATITFSGGTQAIATVNKVAISQLAANLTFAGGTQTVATVQDVQVAQSAATVTFNGGTQAVATVQNTTITQGAGSVTFSGGTQSVGSIINVAVTQVAGVLTFGGGTQVVTGDQVAQTTGSNLLLLGVG